MKSILPMTINKNIYIAASVLVLSCVAVQTSISGPLQINDPAFIATSKTSEGVVFSKMDSTHLIRLEEKDSHFNDAVFSKEWKPDWVSSSGVIQPLPFPSESWDEMIRGWNLAMPNTSIIPANNDLLVNKITSKYNIPQKQAQEIVISAHKQGEEHDLDPILILSLITAESSFNPQARNNSGAVGLMQVIPYWHRDKISALGLSQAQLFHVDSNIQLGAMILKNYLDQNDGNMVRALQKYNGSSKDRSLRYSNKVFQHYNWLFSSNM